VYRWPDPTQDYVIGGDIAENTGGDASCFKIYQRTGFPGEGARGLRLAAEWFGHADEDVLGAVLWRLGWLYSTSVENERIPALLAWERTGPGRSMAKWVNNDRSEDAVLYPLSRLYRSTAVDAVRGRPDHVFGITTSSSTKPAMLSTWKAAAKAGDVQLLQADLTEIASLSRDARGLVNTNSRDRFMASVMATWAESTVMPLVGEVVVEEPEPATGSVAWALKGVKDQREQEDAEW
jgi:hypothetical protein